MCLGGGHKNLGRGTLTQPRPDEFGMRQRSGEYFAPNSMLSFFGMDFALKFEVKTKKIKKGLHRKILGYLITFTRFVLLFHRKSVCGYLFLGKSLLVVLLQKFTLALGAQAVIWRDTTRNAIPPA